jgi:predicted MFS family arabinose efflux permease
MHQPGLAALPARRNPVLLALALSMGAAVSLGIARFAYGLLLPPMRDDLAWSYLLAGSMNTANALGYLLGALALPRLLKRFEAVQVLLFGAALASVFMALSGFFTGASALLLQRLLAGVASALVFATGGLLAARLAAQTPQRSGFLIGLYYGGTGFGIVLSALLVPAVLQAAASQPHAWAWAWWALALGCAAGTLVLLWPARVLGALAQAGKAAQMQKPTSGSQVPLASSQVALPLVFRWRDFRFALASYGLFGVGYIGYMTFVIALIRQQGASPGFVTLFYSLLGVAVVGSSRLWAGLLDRYKGGQTLAILSGLLGLATLVPALTSLHGWLLLSGVLFGAVFLSLVASTTALVRHNLPEAGWAAGISGFTAVFAAGQIVGPTVTGWISDGPGGLERGLIFSAAALWLGALLAWRQRALGA